VFFGVLSMMLGGVLIWGSMTGQFASWYGFGKQEMELALYLGLGLLAYGLLHTIFYGRRRDVDERPGPAKRR
jgi:hypothetical protein